MQSIVRWLSEALQEPRDETLRQRLRIILIAWLFGSTWLMTISGATMTKFAREIGMSDNYFGLLAALPYVMCLAQIPASWVTTYVGGRKRLFLWFVVGGRLMWVLAAAVPWIFPHSKPLWPFLVMACIALAWAGNQAATPAWIQWMSDIVPKRLRGRYFAVRTRLGQFTGLAAVMAVGYALDLTENAMKAPGGDPRLLLKVTSSLLAIASLLGMLDGLGFQRLRDPSPPPKPEKTDLFAATRVALKDKNFRRFLFFQFFFNLGIGFIGQYIWLYVFDVVKLDNSQANMLLLIIPVTIYALACPFWGRLIDRIGRKPVLVIGMCVGIFGAAPWIFIGHGLAMVEVQGRTFSLVSLIAYVCVMIIMAIWPAIDISTSNLLFSFAEKRDSTGENKGQGGTYIALVYVATAIGGAMSGLLGSSIAKLYSDLHWRLPGTPMIVTYHVILFSVSLILRFVALSFVLRIKEPRAMATRQAFWYMTNNVYSNTRDLVAVPVKMFDRVIGWTYRMNPPHRK